MELKHDAKHNMSDVIYLSCLYKLKVFS